ncbi:MAG TPA: methyltransferase domain-containing protein [Caldimonas sp.]|jgi:SAM-dependent methyltransferase|nr:methyltransferase domain-containing protein [Caldimonas sp.]HEX2542497.1 methyltransferase domain-containing protein [Caldimonas sp.]
MPGQRAPFALALAFAFGLALGAASALAQEEVPFITSPDAVTLQMLRSADVRPSDFVLDLGSGDGRIVITAARLFGARGLGVEIVPELVQKSRDNARRAGVEARAEFREQDLFKTDLSPASVITLYLLPEVNLQLRPALLALKPGTRIVSHDWDMGDWRPDRTTELEVPDKQVGREKKSRVHLWIVPAPVAGAWCGRGPLRDSRLHVDQRFQNYEMTVRRGAHVQRHAGVVDGAVLRPREGSRGAVSLRLDGESLRPVGGDRRPGTFQRC